MSKTLPNTPTTIRFKKPSTAERLSQLSEASDIAVVRLIEVAVVTMLDRVDAVRALVIPLGQPQLEADSDGRSAKLTLDAILAEKNAQLKRARKVL